MHSQAKVVPISSTTITSYGNLVASPPLPADDIDDDMDVDVPMLPSNSDDSMDIDVHETERERDLDGMDVLTGRLQLLAIDNDMIIDVANKVCDREPLISGSSIPFVPLDVPATDLESSFNIRVNPVPCLSGLAPPTGSMDFQKLGLALKKKGTPSTLKGHRVAARQTNGDRVKTVKTRKFEESQPESGQIGVATLPFSDRVTVSETTLVTPPAVPKKVTISCPPLSRSVPSLLRWAGKREGLPQEIIPFCPLKFPSPKARRVSFPLEVGAQPDCHPSDAQQSVPPRQVDSSQMPLPKEEEKPEEEDCVLPGAYPTNGVENILHSYCFGAFVSVVCGVGTWMIKTW